MAGEDSEKGGTLMAVVKGVTAIAIMVTAVVGVFKLFVSDDSSPATATSNTGVSREVPNGNITPASLFLNRDSGPGGTTVKVSGEGFGAGERVTFRFHVEQVGTTKANAEGKFSNVSLTIPSTLSQFAPQQFNVVATGDSSIKTATAPFQLTG